MDSLPNHPTDTPLVSVVVPVLNAVSTLPALLEALSQQDFTGKVEYLFVDGASRDGTQNCFQAYEAQMDIRLLTCTEGLSESRKAGVMEAKGTYVAFIDGDCVPPRGWLSAMVHTLESWREKDQKIAGVGGSNVALHDGNQVQLAISLMKDTFLGSYNSVYGRSFGDVRYVDHIATVNAVFLREVLTEDIFHKDLSFSGEDIFMTWTLERKGYRFIYAPGGTVEHSLRPSLRAWMKNMFQYGRGRMFMLLYAPRMLLRKPLYLAPLALSLLPLGLLFTALRPVTIMLLLVYLLLMSLLSLMVAVQSRMYFLLPHLIVLYVLTHVSYGVGELWQLFLSLRRS